MEEVFILSVKGNAVMRSLWIIFQYLLKQAVKMECPNLKLRV